MGILGARRIQTGMGKGRWGRRTGQGTVYLKMLQGNLLLSVLNKNSKYIFKALRGFDHVLICIYGFLRASEQVWWTALENTDCWIYWREKYSAQTSYLWRQNSLSGGDVRLYFSYKLNIDIDIGIDISIRHNPFHCFLLCLMSGVVSSF